jgi:hypothetical protein
MNHEASRISKAEVADLQHPRAGEMTEDLVRELVDDDAGKRGPCDEETGNEHATAFYQAPAPSGKMNFTHAFCVHPPRLSDGVKNVP